MLVLAQTANGFPAVDTVAHVTSAMRDAFPADEPLARFLVSMAIARNDIEHAMWKAAEANEADRPEFDYWVRLVMGHFLEAADALEQWRNCSTEVREFLRTLPPEGAAALKEVATTLSKVGKQAVSHARNHTFHYPTPSARYESDAELIRVLKALGDDPVLLGEVDRRPGRVRYVFADRVALMVAMGKHSTEDLDAYRAQVMDLEAGAAQFVNFVLVAIETRLGRTPQMETEPTLDDRSGRASKR